MMKKLWKEIEIKRLKYDAWAHRLLRMILNKQFRDFASTIDENNYNSDTIFNTITEEPLKQGLKKIYSKVGAEFARDSYNRLKPQKAEYSFEDEFNDYIEREAGSRITSMTAETKRQAEKILRNTLTETAEMGLGATETARQIRKELEKRGIMINQWRALRIARTEVMTASNEGAFVGAKSAGATKKYWIPTYDSRTRDTHLIIEQQNPKLMDEAFLVGNYLMQKPGDPAGGAEEVINCRCAITFSIF